MAAGFYGSEGPSGNPLFAPLQFAASPILGLTESLGEIGVPGFQDLADASFWDPVRGFQEEHPGWAGAAEIASYFVPYAGWAKATRAVPALRGLAEAGARLGGESNALKFALGETARYAPLSAGITTFDLGAGRFEDPWEAARSFAFGTLAGVPLAAAGVRGGTLNSILAQTPILKQIGNIPVPGTGPQRSSAKLGEVITSMIGPSPDERVMYGMPEEVTARVSPELQQEVGSWGYTTHDRPTRVLRDLYALNDAVAAGMRTDISAGELAPHIQRFENEVLRERVSRGDTYVKLAVPAEEGARTVLNQEFTPGVPRVGGRRERLVRQRGVPNDVDTIQQELNLQPEWIGDGNFFRHRRAANRQSANRLRRIFGLVTPGKGTTSSTGFRRVRRQVQDPLDPSRTIQQIWGIRQEQPGGQWIIATELPMRPGAKPNEEINRFFYFKTDVPGRFFPMEATWARNLDDPSAPPVTEAIPPEKLEDSWNIASRVRKGVSQHLDMALGLREMHLSPANFRAFNRDMLKGGSARATVLGSMSGPAAADFATIWNNYFKPLQFQFRNNPDAAFSMGFWRSVFDGYEGLVHRLMFGDRRLEAGKSVLAQMLGKPPIQGDKALYGLTKEFFKQEGAAKDLTRLFRAVNRGATFEQLPEGPAKDYVKRLIETNTGFVTPGNAAMKELGARLMPTKADHWGMSYNFNTLGSNFVPVNDINGQTIGLGVGRNAQGARARAQKLIAQLEGEGTRGLTMGEVFTPDTLRQLPREVRLAITNPGFIQERTNLRGFKWDLEDITEEEWISGLLHNYEARGKWFAERTSKGLSSRELERIARLDPKTNEALLTRLNQLMGITGPFDRLQNRALDIGLSGVFGTNIATRAAAALNRADYALSLGMGNLAFPTLNASTVFQTTLAELAAVAKAPLDWLVRHGYLRPVMGADGLPSGVNSVVGSPLKSLRNGIKIMNQDPGIPERLRTRHLKTFEHLANTFKTGPRFIEEFIGQNSDAKALFMGARDPKDMVEGIERLSSWLPGVSEKLSRTWTAGSAMDMLDSMEALGLRQFTDDEYAQWVANFVDRTNFLYGPVDRPQIFTTPLGSLFGSRKNWYVNYLNLLFEYGGLAGRGNFGPLLFALGGTAGLGGLVALPLAPNVLDWFTETFYDKDLVEAVYEQFGENGDLAFGLPARLGVSFAGAAGAPGADFFGDAEFLTSFVSLRRAENFGTSLARGADLIRLGLDPFEDPMFRQQLSRWAAPNSMYKALDAFADNEITSPTTGRPMSRNLSLKDQLLYSAGFTTTEIERGRAVYERMLRDKAFRARTIQLLGEGYYQASVENDRAQMQEILRAAMNNGIGMDSLLQSAAKRARDDGRDMFGRAIPRDVLERYPSVVEETEDQGFQLRERP